MDARMHFALCMAVGYFSMQNVSPILDRYAQNHSIDYRSIRNYALCSAYFI